MVGNDAAELYSNHIDNVIYKLMKSEKKNLKIEKDLAKNINDIQKRLKRAKQIIRITSKLEGEKMNPVSALNFYKRTKLLIIETEDYLVKIGEFSKTQQTLLSALTSAFRKLGRDKLIGLSRICQQKYGFKLKSPYYLMSY